MGQLKIHNTPSGDLPQLAVIKQTLMLQVSKLTVTEWTNRTTQGASEVFSSHESREVFPKNPSGVGFSIKSSNGRVAMRGAARQAKAERTSPTTQPRGAGGFICREGVGY